MGKVLRSCICFSEYFFADKKKKPNALTHLASDTTLCGSYMTGWLGFKNGSKNSAHRIFVYSYIYDKLVKKFALFIRSNLSHLQNCRRQVWKLHCIILVRTNAEAGPATAWSNRPAAKLTPATATLSISKHLMMPTMQMQIRIRNEIYSISSDLLSRFLFFSNIN